MVELLLLYYLRDVTHVLCAQEMRGSAGRKAHSLVLTVRWSSMKTKPRSMGKENCPVVVPPCKKRKGCCLDTINDFQVHGNDGDLVAWINKIIGTNFDKLKDALGGAAACQIIDKLHHRQNDVFTRSQWIEIDWLPTQSFICEKNYKLLFQVLCDKLKIDKHFDIVPLARQRMMACRSFYSWLKHYYEKEIKTRSARQVESYPAQKRRKLQKNGKDFQRLVDDAYTVQNGNARCTIKLAHLLKIDHTTLSSLDRKVSVKWPSNLRSKQLKKRKHRNNRKPVYMMKAEEVAFNMFYSDSS